MSQLCWRCGQIIWDTTPHVCIAPMRDCSEDPTILQQILQELKEIKEKLNERRNGP